MRLFAIFVASIFCKLFYKHKVYGKEHLNFSQGAILAPNHASYLDPPIVGISCPDEVHFLAREGLFRAPLFGWLIRKLNTHPIAKGSGNLGTIKKACEFIENGKKVVIFPEGRRTPTGELQEGQLGIGLLVLRTQCLIVPIYIHGTYEIWSIDRKSPKLSGKTACVFGSPLHFELTDEKDRKQMQQVIAQTVMSAIAQLKDWYLKGAKGTPP